ncbi:MAG: hemolysin family protein, partial [Deinococcus sp.]|nr:hemolysin family protein [Deinococcus sp.]
YSTDALLKLFGRPGAHEPPVTEEEIRVLMHEGTRAGVFEEAEQDIVHSVLSLGDRQVDSLMTPRPDVVWLDLEDTIEETQRKITESPHARFPVAEGSLDTVKGVVRARDLVLLGGKLTKEALTALLQPPLYVPGNLSAFQLLEQFKKSRTHMALVIDEYGGLQGIVTLHDILEAILGDLPGAEAEEEPWVLKREDGSYLIDGALPIEEFKELFELDRLPEEEKYRTLGGLVLAELGRIPTAGESFTFEGLTIEVVDMDANRIDKVLVSKHKEPSRSNPPEEKPVNG